MAALLMKLPHEVLAYLLLLPVHANCHRADLAFRDAMDSNHEFLDHVADTMNAIVVWYRNAPTRLRNMRHLSLALQISPLQYNSLSQRCWAAFAHQTKNLKFPVHE